VSKAKKGDASSASPFVLSEERCLPNHPFL
jgi:hypothetical protein